MAGIAKSKYDKYKNLYVEDGKTLKQIADEFGLNYRSFLQHSMKRKWTDAKKKYQKCVSKELEKLTQKRILESAERIEDKNLRRAHYWRIAQGLVVKFFDNSDELSPKDLLVLIQALEKACKGERLEDGQPTELVKEETNVQKDTIFEAVSDQEGVIMDQEDEIVRLKTITKKLEKTLLTLQKPSK